MGEKMIFTDTIYDICKQQDCLSSDKKICQVNNYLIPPAKNATGFDVVFTDKASGISISSKPDSIFYMPSNYVKAEIVKTSFESSISMKLIRESLIKKGYYDLTIEYKFNYVLQFFDKLGNKIPVYIQGTPVLQVQAYSVYIKEVSLFGGCIKNTVVTLNSSSGEECSKYPEYNIQAVAEDLSVDLLKINCLVCNPYINQSLDKLDPKGVTVVGITIGLFTMISLFRKNIINVLTGEKVSIPTCEDNLDSCEKFLNIPFLIDGVCSPKCGE